jgi:hypothetical protein
MSGGRTQEWKEVNEMSKKSKRILELLNNPRHRNHMMGSLNKSALDDGAAPVGKGEMTILKDMGSLDQEHGQHIQDLKGGGRGE